MLVVEKRLMASMQRFPVDFLVRNANAVSKFILTGGRRAK